jgi:hypothetical protein
MEAGTEFNLIDIYSTYYENIIYSALAAERHP